MIADKKNFSLGIFLLLIPLFGIPLWWKYGLIIVLALILILVSIKLPKTFELPIELNGKGEDRIQSKTAFRSIVSIQEEKPLEQKEEIKKDRSGSKKKSLSKKRRVDTVSKPKKPQVRKVKSENIEY